MPGSFLLYTLGHLGQFTLSPENTKKNYLFRLCERGGRKFHAVRWFNTQHWSIDRGFFENLGKITKVNVRRRGPMKFASKAARRIWHVSMKLSTAAWRELLHLQIEVDFKSWWIRLELHDPTAQEVVTKKDFGNSCQPMINLMAVVRLNLELTRKLGNEEKGMNVFDWSKF